MTNPLQAGVAGVIETLEALTRGLKKDDFDAGAWAARSEALDMLRPLIAEPLVSPLQAGVDHAELRRLAEAAVNEPWIGITSGPKPAAGEILVGVPDGRDWPVVAEFIFAAKPVRILALLNEIDALRAAPVLPDRGWRPDREAIARIVSPSSWEAREAAINEGYEWMDRDPTNWGEDTRTFMRDQRFRDGDGFVSPSLAKADAILALPDAPSEGAE